MIIESLSALSFLAMAVSLAVFAVWLAKQSKINARSRWSWWTPSGIISRTISIFASKWSETPNDLWPVAVFAYGICELYGLIRGTKLLVRFHAAQAKKLRQRARVHATNTAASGNSIGGTSS